MTKHWPCCSIEMHRILRKSQERKGTGIPKLHPVVELTEGGRWLRCYVRTKGRIPATGNLKRSKANGVNARNPRVSSSFCSNARTPESRRVQDRTHVEGLLLNTCFTNVDETAHTYANGPSLVAQMLFPECACGMMNRRNTVCDPSSKALALPRSI